MNLNSDEISFWGESLDDFSPEFSPVKCWSVLQFFVLTGRKTVISKNNLEPIKDLHYTLFSPQEKKYYFKEFRNYPLDVLYYYRPSLYFSGEDDAVSSLRTYVEDGNIHLLFTPEGVTQMSVMLQRVYKANVNGDGKLDYRTWIKIMELSLQMEDYHEFYANSIGYKTTMKVWNEELAELWKRISLKK